MSQFSVSFHLKTDNPQDCVDMLKNCGLKGYVFPTVNSWTSFVCEDEEISNNHKLIKENRGLLIYYTFAEDFGWGFSIFKSGKNVCSYDCMWGGPIFDEYGEVLTDDDGEILELEDLRIEDGKLKMTVILELLENNFSKANLMKELLFPESIEDAIQNMPSYGFAKLLGIENIDWISYDYVTGNPDEYKRIIEV